jgi:hypothetical protein
MSLKPHILLVIARGEAVRNFLYSDTLDILRQNARVTLLSVLTDQVFLTRFLPHVDEIIELKDYPESKWVGRLRDLIAYAHYRWLWTEKVRNKWRILDSRAITFPHKIRHAIWKSIIYILANRPALNILTWLENHLSLWLNPTNDLESLFGRLQPDLVFNTSHIHAPRGELPVRVAHQMGIPTAAFIFSWDNLSSRGRILPPYDDYLVWHEGMRDELLRLYPSIVPERIHITGTPQFDYHFLPTFCLPREELYSRLGLDPSRPFILYTTGMDRDFPEEVRHVRTTIGILNEIDSPHRPQLVVRTYIKGTSPEMKALAAENLPGVVFPPILWDEKWLTPHYDDLALYSSLLHHCALGINPASTVSLELMMLDKPVINLGFDPPGSQLPPGFSWKRHIEFDHYRRVAASGAVTVVCSVDDLRQAILRALAEPSALSEKRRVFIQQTFGSTLDGRSGQRVAKELIRLAVLKK